MKQISIRLYQFSELDEDAKKKALNKMRDINLDHRWWDFVYDNFKTIAAYIGITVDLKKTYFSGFYHQGQGSAYTASVDVKKLLHGVKTMGWREHAPKVQLDFPAIATDRRILDLIQRDFINSWVKVETTNRDTSVNVSVDLRFSYNKCKNYNCIEDEVSRLEKAITEVCEELNHFLFTTLKKEYEYLSSDAAVKDTIEANEYSFTADGHPASCIERLAE